VVVDSPLLSCGVMSHMTAAVTSRAISLAAFDEKMTAAQLVNALTGQLQRNPDPPDLYHVRL
jgi:hypothetical protein